MTLVPVSLPPGVVRSATPLQTKGRYWDSNLVRWRSNKLLPVGGWQRISTSPLASSSRTIFPWATNNGNAYAAFGCDNQLYVLDSSTYRNITPPGFIGPNSSQYGGYGAWQYGKLLYGTDTTSPYQRPSDSSYIPVFSWTIDNWGEEILAVASSDGRLLHFEVDETYAEPVGTNTIVTAVRVSNVVTVTTLHGHGFTAGAIITITGNSLGNMNGTWTIVSVPTTTTFTFSSATANGTGTGGTASRSGIPTGNRAVIVTQERHAVLMGAGGNPRRVGWSNREDYTDWNYSNPNNTAGYLDLDTSSEITMCAAVREGTIIWTEDEAWLMRFIGLPYVYSIERIGFGCGLVAPRAFATVSGRCIWMGRETFWLYDGGVVKPLNCDVGSYVFDDLDAASGALYTHGSENNLFPEAWFWYPSNGSTYPNRYVCYNYAEQWWSIGEMPRTSAVGAGVFPYPITSDTSNLIYYQENGWTAAGDQLLGTRYAESGSLNVQQGNLTSFVGQVMTDSGYSYDSTSLTFFSSFTPEGAETETGPYYPRADGYTDTRVTGRDVRVKIMSTKDQEWSIGELRLDVVPRGKR
jgi:hypothetical protein